MFPTERKVRMFHFELPGCAHARRWRSLRTGLKWVDDRLQSRISYGNYLAGGLALVGGYFVYSAFNDPDAGTFERGVPFSNWSATHSITCECAHFPETLPLPQP